MLFVDMATSVSVTPNARVQPQIRAQREFVGWNPLLGVILLHRKVVARLLLHAAFPGCRAGVPTPVPAFRCSR